MTVFRFESGQADPYRTSLEKIVNELERRGIEFTDGNSPPSQGAAIGVRLNLMKSAEFVRMSTQASNEPER